MIGKTLHKFAIQPAAQRLAALSVSAEAVADMEAKWKFFFILASGRSGTNFLADLLMDEVKHQYVYHEPVLEDMAAQVAAYYSDEKGFNYLQGFRKREIYSRIKIYSPGVYGEVNPQLRFHTQALKRAFPDAKILHVVRDGRKVVRSTMSRKTYTLFRPNSMAIHPQGDDPWKGNWDNMDRFARICWNWFNDNRRLRLALGHPIQFEKYLTDYEYFHREIVLPLGLNVSKEDWQKHISKPRNTTREFTFPDWKEWSEVQKQTFQQICGEEMGLNGYPM